MKGREETKPFIVLAASVDQFPLLGIARRSGNAGCPRFDLAGAAHRHPSAACAHSGKPRSVVARGPDPRAGMASRARRAGRGRSSRRVRTAAASRRSTARLPRTRVAGSPRRNRRRRPSRRANLRRLWTLPPPSRTSCGRVNISLHRNCGKRCGNRCEKRCNPQKIAVFSSLHTSLCEQT